MTEIWWFLARWTYYIVAGATILIVTALASTGL